jgi:hypothetical protein
MSPDLSPTLTPEILTATEETNMTETNETPTPAPQTVATSTLAPDLHAYASALIADGFRVFYYPRHPRPRPRAGLLADLRAGGARRNDGI